MRDKKKGEKWKIPCLEEREQKRYKSSQNPSNILSSSELWKYRSQRRLE